MTRRDEPLTSPLGGRKSKDMRHLGDKLLCVTRGVIRSLKCCAFVDGCDYAVGEGDVPALVQVLKCETCGRTSIGWKRAVFIGSAEQVVVSYLARLGDYDFDAAVRRGKIALLAAALGLNSRALIKQIRRAREDLDLVDMARF